MNIKFNTANPLIARFLNFIGIKSALIYASPLLEVEVSRYVNLLGRKWEHEEFLKILGQKDPVQELMKQTGESKESVESALAFYHKNLDPK